MIEAVIIILTAYSVLNIIDYSWTYIRSDRAALELSSRLKFSRSDQPFLTFYLYQLAKSHQKLRISECSQQVQPTGSFTSN